MSEIKLRAWDEGSRIMHYDFQFIQSGTESNDWIVFTSDKQHLYYSPHPFQNPFSVRQFKKMLFSGVVDRDGVEIYEGDYIRVGKKVMEVKFIKGGVRTQHKDSDYRLGAWVTNKVKVVGNIYQNT